MSQHLAGHRQVWQLAGPLILSNISLPLVGMVDTAVVGHLDHATAIGAVALGALIFSFLYWGFGFLRMATTGFVARAYGANDHREIHCALLRALLLALGFAGLSIVLRAPLIDFALFCLQASARIETLTSDYAHIRIFSAPAALCIYVFTGVFIGLHDTRKALLLQLILNLLNIALDLLFVPGLKMGVAGVAYASLLAEYCAALVGFWLLRAHLWRGVKTTTWARLLHRQALLDLLHTNRHIFIRTLCLVFAFAYFTNVSARFGAVVLAANTILLHLMSISAYALDGFAHAAEAMVGRAVGARDRAVLYHNIKITSQWALASGVAISLAYALLGHYVLGFFTDLPAVLASANQYLIWMVFAPLVSVASYQLDGIFIGSGHTRQMQNAMLVSTVGYLGVLQLLLPGWGNHGLYLGLLLFMSLRALTLLYYLPHLVAQVDHK